MAGYLAIVAVLDEPIAGPVDRPDQDERLATLALERLLPLCARLRGWHAASPGFRMGVAVAPTFATAVRGEAVTSRLDARVAALAADDPRRVLWHDVEGDPIGALAELEQAGAIELLGCTASSAVLPLYASAPLAVAAQVAVGCQEHVRLFGHRPRGLWLPACAWAPELDGPLAREGLRFCVVAPQSIVLATPRPLHGLHAPIVTSEGVAAFGAGGAAVAPEPEGLDRPGLALVVHEIDGPGALEAVDRVVREAHPARFVTLAEYLARHPENQRAMPAPATAAPGGWFEPWLPSGAQHLVHAHHACRRMTALARSHPRADGLVRRVLDQAARELLLLQSRDDQGFAAHLTRFGRLAAMAESGVLDEARVALWERRSPVFPQLDYRVFSLGGSAPEPRELATAE